MPGKTRTCYKCHIVDLKENMISVNDNGKAPFICIKCHNEKVMREKFSDAVCHIFGIKAPGNLWKERNKIIKEYGYTDQIILDTLEYLYNIKGWKVYGPKIINLITPPNVEAMMKYKRRKDYEENKIVSAFVAGINNKTQPLRVHIKEKIKEKPNWDIDDEFFDD